MLPNAGSDDACWWRLQNDPCSRWDELSGVERELTERERETTGAGLYIAAGPLTLTTGQPQYGLPGSTG